MIGLGLTLDVGRTVCVTCIFPGDTLAESRRIGQWQQAAAFSGRDVMSKWLFWFDGSTPAGDDQAPEDVSLEEIQEALDREINKHLGVLEGTKL